MVVITYRSDICTSVHEQKRHRKCEDNQPNLAGCGRNLSRKVTGTGVPMVILKRDESKAIHCVPSGQRWPKGGD